MSTSVLSHPDEVLSLLRSQNKLLLSHEKILVSLAEMCSQNTHNTNLLIRLVERLAPSSPSPPAVTYADVAKAVHRDEATIKDKATRLVIVGRPECATFEETRKADEHFIRELVELIADPQISDEFARGDISFHRHLDFRRTPTTNRVMKIQTKNSVVRDVFLRAIWRCRRKSLNHLVFAYARRDLTEEELSIERDLQAKCRALNDKAGQVEWVVRDCRAHRLPQPRPFKNHPQQITLLDHVPEVATPVAAELSPAAAALSAASGSARSLAPLPSRGARKQSRGRPASRGARGSRTASSSSSRSVSSHSSTVRACSKGKRNVSEAALSPIAEDASKKARGTEEEGADGEMPDACPPVLDPQ